MSSLLVLDSNVPSCRSVPCVHIWLKSTSSMEGIEPMLLHNSIITKLQSLIQIHWLNSHREARTQCEPRQLRWRSPSPFWHVCHYNFWGKLSVEILQRHMVLMVFEMWEVIWHFCSMCCAICVWRCALSTCMCRRFKILSQLSHLHVSHDMWY